MSVPLDLFPDTTRIELSDRLAIGGCDLVDLAEEHGTPLYIYDAETIIARAGALREALAASYPGKARVCYAAKAYVAPWLLSLLAGEDLGLDVVSAGELYVAAAAKFPMTRTYFHGNNKGKDELEYALEQKIGRIVVDNQDEIARLGLLTSARSVKQPVLLRVAPGVDVHTHAHLTTGAPDTKFGLDIASGAAKEGVRAILAHPGLELRGFHAHIGSQIREVASYQQSVERIFAFAAQMRDELGFTMRELSPGGGYAVRYLPGDPDAKPAEMVHDVATAVVDAAKKHRFELPELTIEPGRAIIAPAGVALYRVGSVKRGARTYVAVDGGMADNIRPTAYGAEYTAVLANRVGDTREMTDVAIAGKYCETGDILIQKVRLPLPRVGDLVAIPVSGAYQLAMSSNYNMAPRPAVVVVADRVARLVRRRETPADLLTGEVL
ncbi:MAG: diaminopimelate decarboxylase [Chloroflexota bacterium]|nr:diaminopimelate decarboxylase [Chloroflexota bacterium]